MKNKRIIYIIIGIIITIICILLVFALIKYNQNNTNNNDERKYKTGNFYKINNDYEDTRIEDINTIITSKQELLDLFPNYNKNLDFSKHNYALFEIIIDSCSEKNVHPTGYSLENNNLYIKIEYEAKCGVCAPEYEYYLLELPKSITDTNINLINKALNDPKCDPAIAYKPMIYLYPQEETNVTVKLGNPNYLTTTYPKYNDSWNVIAEPDGTLKTNNREYYGLFWEGTNHQAKVKEDGFIVEGKDVEHFLEEKLDILGLTNKEANEFIIYWLPKLEDNKYNYIRFETIEEVNEYMPLEITPNPDTIIRVLMDYKPLDKPINITEQKLTKTSRIGFSVVEWGGSLIK